MHRITMQSLRTTFVQQRTQPIKSNFRLDNLPPNPSTQIQNGDGDSDINLLFPSEAHIALIPHDKNAINSKKYINHT